MCAGADGNLYFVLAFSGRVMRIPVDGGSVEEFATGLAAPSSARWWPDGRVWVSQGGSGEVSRIDPASGAIETVAQLRPGIDNLAIAADGRLFVSYYIDGEVLEVGPGSEPRVLVPRGLLAPYGIAAGAAGTYVADGMELVRLGPNRFEEVQVWIDDYRRLVEQRFDRLEELLEREKGEQR